MGGSHSISGGSDRTKVWPPGARENSPTDCLSVSSATLVFSGPIVDCLWIWIATLFHFQPAGLSHQILNSPNLHNLVSQLLKISLSIYSICIYMCVRVCVCLSVCLLLVLLLWRTMTNANVIYSLVTCEMAALPVSSLALTHPKIHPSIYKCLLLTS